MEIGSINKDIYNDISILLIKIYYALINYT